MYIYIASTYLDFLCFWLQLGTKQHFPSSRLCQCSGHLFAWHVIERWKMISVEEKWRVALKRFRCNLKIVAMRIALYGCTLVFVLTTATQHCWRRHTGLGFNAPQNFTWCKYQLCIMRACKQWHAQCYIACDNTVQGWGIINVSLLWHVAGLWPNIYMAGLCPNTYMATSWWILGFPLQFVECACMVCGCRNVAHPGPSYCTTKISMHWSSTADIGRIVGPLQCVKV